jgi:hypothetical protein
VQQAEVRSPALGGASGRQSPSKAPPELPTPGLPPGALSNAAAAPSAEQAVLTLWNPDASWEREPFVLVKAEMASARDGKKVVRSLELLVHPLEMVITEELAASLWVRRRHGQAGVGANCLGHGAVCLSVTKDAADQHG